MALCTLHHKFTPVTTSDLVKAFCYLEHINDEKNKIWLTENHLEINYRNKLERYDLPQIKDITFGHRKAMLYLLSGGIGVPFTAVAFSRDFLDPWPTLFILFGGVFAIYLGWRGYQVLTIHIFGLNRDYRLNGVSDNIQAFVDFTLKVLPINLPVSSQSERMIFHITDIATWKGKRSKTHYNGFQQHGFIHTSTFNQLEGTHLKYFKGRSQLLLLTIDPLLVNAEIRYEDLMGEGQLFPHIYGNLNLDAVVRIEELI